MRTLPDEEAQFIVNSAETDGLRLKDVDGKVDWGSMPGQAYQRTVGCVDRRTRAGSVTLECGCCTLPDVHIRFPNRDPKRTDLSNFCQMPDKQLRAIRAIPVAVEEVGIRGFKLKDLVFAPPFWLSQGVLDPVVINPFTFQNIHFTAGQETHLPPGATLNLKLGCSITVPGAQG